MGGACWAREALRRREKKKSGDGDTLTHHTLNAY